MSGAAEATSSPQDPSKTAPSSANIMELIWRLIKNCFLIVARFYIMIILVGYEWIRKIVIGVLSPFEPIFVQVRKVPKKDVSVEGIFYQFIRLQFLILLYMTPLLRSWLAYFIQPLFRLKDWATDFVDFEEKTRRVGVKE